MDREFVKSQPSETIRNVKPRGMNTESLINSFRDYYVHLLGRDEESRSIHYAYEALGLVIRDRLMERWNATHRTYKKAGSRRMFYLSMEYLIGRSLNNALLNLDITDNVREALGSLGIDLEELLEVEQDAGLGNGGLGRLAACFMDSCATLQLPVIGYGLRYEYGMFTQKIVNGEQKELPDHWLRMRNVWECRRMEYARRVHFGGHTQVQTEASGRRRALWTGTEDVLAVPYDMPVPGFRNNTVNTLRLWKAIATEEFHLNEFNSGDYIDAVHSKIFADNITMVLYPNDSSLNGRELRLRQQYFLASASLQDVLAHWVGLHGRDFNDFAQKNCFQINDTHPSIAIAELMRLLVDEYDQPWDDAWLITSSSMAYTNHTLLPEALECWPLPMMQRLLPRLVEIIFAINAEFLSDVAEKWPGNVDMLRRLSLIDEAGEKQVRMSHLAIIGSYSVNGVSKLHSQLLREKTFTDFFALQPAKFNNKTNGVTPRRWLLSCNPDLSNLITETIGPKWITDLSLLTDLLAYADDAGFQHQWQTVKRSNKQRLADFKRDHLRGQINVDAIFDVQVKRIHEYKRQVLKLLHVIHLYIQLKQGLDTTHVPRCVLIGGKAAPGYFAAKRIIKLIHNIATVINNDSSLGGQLSLLFLPDYCVSALEKICPGADLSEQISTAGKEASGTSNMKLMMNGAITIGTYDGANNEILEAVGSENCFLFGLSAEQLASMREQYDPQSLINNDSRLREVIELLESGHFNQFEYGIFDELIAMLKNPHDPWMVLADFADYLETQYQVEAAFSDNSRWIRMSIANVAHCGQFSSDRTINEYNRDIWKLRQLPVKLNE
ncbi:MAG: glycogen/starch/alpha-glucan phosphorylase [Methylophaga sp.]|nr:glycogen/starch/alpha-glucan phosphorylase [Methylophaga sp.]